MRIERVEPEDVTDICESVQTIAGECDDLGSPYTRQVDDHLRDAGWTRSSAKQKEVAAPTTWLEPESNGHFIVRCGFQGMNRSESAGTDSGAEIRGTVERDLRGARDRKEGKKLRRKEQERLEPESNGIPVDFRHTQVRTAPLSRLFKSVGYPLEDCARTVRAKSETEQDRRRDCNYSEKDQPDVDRDLAGGRIGENRITSGVWRQTATNTAIQLLVGSATGNPGPIRVKTRGW
ncbi:hypothetical protein DFH09DRAFT_1076669 [Mycena vulgaris]|nr:hypothetical protein DFH09DRAFT_1076669 [Mycena vulgaris]